MMGIRIMPNSDTFDETADALAGIGHNNPPLARLIAAETVDFAIVTTAYLEDEYGKHKTIVTALLAEATALMRDPATGKLKTIEDDATKGKVASLIKRMRDQAKALDALHSKEKTPYLRGGQAADQFFFGEIDKLDRRNRTAKPGASDVLNSSLTDYDNRLLAAEQARRDREAAEQRRIAQEALQKAQAEEAAAEEARLAAERARKPETQEAKGAVARAQEAVADAARVEAIVAGAKAEQTHMATFAKPADLMRTRGADGTLSTVGTEKYAEITDRTLLDIKMLAPYIKLEALESALTQWAKFTDYNTPMTGAAIGRRNRSSVR
jgi:hypothetical protein